MNGFRLALMVAWAISSHAEIALRPMPNGLASRAVFAPPSRSTILDGAKPLAKTLRERIARLSSELKDRQEQFVLETLPFGGSVKEATMRYRRETQARALEIMAIAEQLSVYQATGVIPPPKRFDPNILDIDVDPEMVLNIGSHPMSKFPLFSLDLVMLKKQLARYGSSEARPQKSSAAVYVVSTLPAAASSKPTFDPLLALIIQLSDADSRRRSLAADALGQRGAASISAIPALRLAATSAEARVRASAVLALSRIAPNDPVVRQLALRALLDKAEDVRFSAQTALNYIETNK